MPERFILKRLNIHVMSHVEPVSYRQTPQATGSLKIALIWRHCFLPESGKSRPTKKQQRNQQHLNYRNLQLSNSYRSRPPLQSSNVLPFLVLMPEIDNIHCAVLVIAHAVGLIFLLLSLKIPKFVFFGQPFFQHLLLNFSPILSPHLHAISKS